jgi:TolB protein
MTRYVKIIASLALFLLLCTRSFAVLNIQLTQGVDKPLPIAVVPFAWDSSSTSAPEEIAAIIEKDLHNSGEFSALVSRRMQQFPHQVGEIDYQHWRDQGVHNMIIGKLQLLSSNQYKIEFALIDLFPDQKNLKGDPILLSKVFVVRGQDLRRLSHHISDLIYQKLTGQSGVFSTRLAYVLVKQQAQAPTQYMLEVSDIDGANAKPILQSPEPIMSPAWSPDGKKLAYVSFEGKRARIFISDIMTGERELISEYPGINGAPAWSPDAKWLAVALAQHGSPDIYLLKLSDKRITKLTNDFAINTEPSWSADGKSLVFTSDRGGTPQIYQLDLATRQVKRVTFQGNYNSSAKYSRDGHSMILLHRNQQHMFNIALFDWTTNTLQELTHTGYNESPSLAPNGKMVVYANQQEGTGVLGMISIDGRVQLHLPAREGRVQEPVWSPFLQNTNRL